MVASTQALVAVGIPPTPALLIGESIVQSTAGVGTTAATAALLTGTVNTVTTAGGALAFILQAHNPGRQVRVYNTSATSASVFPPTGGNIDGAGVDTAVAIAVNKGRLFDFITPLIIKSILSA